jgi:glucokinase
VSRAEPLTMGRAAVVGIDFGGTKIDVARADAADEVLERVRLATEAHKGAEQALERTVAAVKELAQQSANHGEPVLGYAAVSPGVVRDDRSCSCRTSRAGST